VQDAGQAVGELAQGGVVPGAAGALLVVAGAGAGRGAEGGEGLGQVGVDEPIVAGEPGQGGFLLVGSAGDRAGCGVDALMDVKWQFLVQACQAWVR
jgi:hypothetical protein